MIQLTRRQWSIIFHIKINDDGFGDIPQEQLMTLEEYTKGMFRCSHRGSDKHISLALIATFYPEACDYMGVRWQDILTKL